MLETLLSFEVSGEPAPQGSKTRTATHVREDNPRTEPWRNAVAAAAIRAMSDDVGLPRAPLTGPLRLVVEFRFARPRGHFGTGRNEGQLKASAPVYVQTRPDLDKLLRAIGDALTGIAVVDDNQLVEVAASKRYGPPGCRIAIRSLNGHTPGDTPTEEV